MRYDPLSKGPHRREANHIMRVGQIIIETLYEVVDTLKETRSTSLEQILTELKEISAILKDQNK